MVKQPDMREDHSDILISDFTDPVFQGAFRQRGICTGIPTTDTAERFYERHGYVRAPGCRAKNHDGVFVKRLN